MSETSISFSRAKMFAPRSQESGSVSAFAASMWPVLSPPIKKKATRMSLRALARYGTCHVKDDWRHETPQHVRSTAPFSTLPLLARPLLKQGRMRNRFLVACGVVIKRERLASNAFGAVEWVGVAVIRGVGG